MVLPITNIRGNLLIANDLVIFMGTQAVRLLNSTTLFQYELVNRIGNPPDGTSRFVKRSRLHTHLLVKVDTSVGS